MLIVIDDDDEEECTKKQQQQQQPSEGISVDDESIYKKIGRNYLKQGGRRTEIFQRGGVESTDAKRTGEDILKMKKKWQ